MNKISRTAAALLGTIFVLASIGARAGVITATIPAADFSLPATIGTFTYFLPPGQAIDAFTLFGPHFSFQPGTAFDLVIAIDGVDVFSLPLSQTASDFSTGSRVSSGSLAFAIDAPLLSDGSAALSFSCKSLPSFPGPCPGNFTFYVPSSGGLTAWKLVIDTVPIGSVPEPGTLALMGVGLTAILLWRRKRSI